MDKEKEIIQTSTGWKCSHCGAFNKIIAAKFCGKCGSARKKEDNSEVLKSEIDKKVEESNKETISIDKAQENIEQTPGNLVEETKPVPNDDNKDISESDISKETSENKDSSETVDSKESSDNKDIEKSSDTGITAENKASKWTLKAIFNKIKSFFSPSKDKMFKIVIFCASLILIASIVAGYKMYTNVNTIRLSKTRFSDVAVDHPIYSVCKRLLGIDAISFRKNLELAPYEKISTVEWNHVLTQASKHLNQQFSSDAYFSSDDCISVESLNNKLRAIKENSSEIIDTLFPYTSDF